MVEEEMRELLHEKESSKKAFEAKIKKVTQAFMDLQQDVWRVVYWLAFFLFKSYLLSFAWKYPSNIIWILFMHAL